MRRARAVLVPLLGSLFVLLAGCTGGSRAMDPAGTAVRDARSAPSALVLAADLHRQGRATDQVAQVTLDNTLDAVATAQTDLLTASDADPARRATASTALASATSVLVGLGDRGAADLSDDDLHALREADDTLGAAAQELGA